MEKIKVIAYVKSKIRLRHSKNLSAALSKHTTIPHLKILSSIIIGISRICPMKYRLCSVKIEIVIAENAL